MALSSAYAGSGKTTKENVAAVLDNLLPNELGMVYVPVKVTRLQPGLRTTIEWLEGEVGADGTIPTEDLIAALVERRDAGDDVVLAMVYDAENEHDVTLAKAAHDAGIRVIDIASAGDDIVFEEAAETEPEAPADEPPFEGGTPIAPTPDVAEQVAAATQAGLDAALSARMATVQQVPGVTVQFNVTFGPEAVDSLAAAIVAAMGMQARATVTTAHAPAGTAEALAPVVPIGTVHDGSNDAAGQPEGTTPYYYNKDADKYRPVRGRKRPAEERVFLTPEQVKQVTDSGLLA